MIEPAVKKRLYIRVIEILLWPLLLFVGRADRGNHDGVRKILVLELWGIGDVVLATGALAALRSMYPEAEIHFLGKSYSNELLDKHCSNAIVQEFSFPWTEGLKGKYHILRWPWREMVELIKALRGNKYDIVLEPRGDIRNHVLMRLIGAKNNIGFSFGSGWMLDSVAELPSKDSHRVEDWGRVLSILTGHYLGKVSPGLRLSEEEKSAVAEKYSLMQVGWIGVHVAASNNSKQWPLERFERLIDEIVSRYPLIPVVVFVSPSGYGEGLRLPNKVTVARCSTLRELMAAIANCRALVALDGGPMHIGAALEVPVIALFGPTREQWFGPTGDRHKVIVENECEYRPCFDYCRYDSPRCMEGITVDRVIREVESIGVHWE